MSDSPNRVFDSAMRAAIDREAKASAALDGETVVCEPTRQFDPDLGEVTTQAEDGEVIRVEGCAPPAREPLPWHFNSDALQLGKINSGPCVRITRFIRDDPITVVMYAACDMKGTQTQTLDLSEAIGIAEAWWARQAKEAANGPCVLLGGVRDRRLAC